MSSMVIFIRDVLNESLDIKNGKISQIFQNFVTIYLKVIWKPCVSYTAKGTEERMRGKINKLATELLLDAVSKIDSVQNLRYELHKSVPFQYGTLNYEMRYRHKKIVKIYTDVLHAQETGTGDDEQYMAAIADVDTLAHEIINFATMLQMHDANLHSDKTNPTYDLFFRRNNMAPVWLGLLDSLDNNDYKDLPKPSTPPPVENNQTQTGKRRNGVWHYASPID